MSQKKRREGEGCSYLYTRSTFASRTASWPPSRSSEKLSLGELLVTGSSEASVTLLGPGAADVDIGWVREMCVLSLTMREE